MESHENGDREEYMVKTGMTLAHSRSLLLLKCTCMYIVNLPAVPGQLADEECEINLHSGHLQFNENLSHDTAE